MTLKQSNEMHPYPNLTEQFQESNLSKTKKKRKDREAISTLHHISQDTNCFVVLTMFSTIECYMHG